MRTFLLLLQKRQWGGVGTVYSASQQINTTGLEGQDNLGNKKQKLTRLRFRTVGISWKRTMGGGTD